MAPTGLACSAGERWKGLRQPVWSGASATGREKNSGVCRHSVVSRKSFHEFTTLITEPTCRAVEAALLRQAQRIVPTCRVELDQRTGPA